jgi:pimeloyl-ACP methyl ester carboxylesterase
VTADGMVLVHGSNLSAACWDSVLPHLTAPAVAVDLPGRGSRPADILTVTLDQCVEAVLESAREAGFGEFALVGHSLGGVVITEVASRHPALISGLVYVGALVPATGGSAAEVIFGNDLPTTRPQMATEQRAKLFFANDMTDEQWNTVWRQFVPESPLLWNARMHGHPGRMPVTYISMIEDVGVPPDLVEQMIANVGAEVEHQVLQAGHVVMTTRPRDLANAINSATNC